MGAAIALRRLVPVKVIGSRMRIVFILLAVVVFEAAHSTVTEFDEVEAFDTTNGSEEMELDQEVALVEKQRIKGLPNWLDRWAHGKKGQAIQTKKSVKKKKAPAPPPAPAVTKKVHGRNVKKKKKFLKTHIVKKKPPAKLVKKAHAIRKQVRKTWEERGKKQAKKKSNKAEKAKKEKKAKCEKADKKEKKAKAAAAKGKTMRIEAKKKKEASFKLHERLSKHKKKPAKARKGPWYERAQKILEKLAKINANKHKRHLERMAKRKRRERARKEHLHKFIAKIKHTTEVSAKLLKKKRKERDIKRSELWLKARRLRNKKRRERAYKLQHEKKIK